jgi:hypothetical protein
MPSRARRPSDAELKIKKPAMTRRIIETKNNLSMLFDFIHTSIAKILS